MSSLSFLTLISCSLNTIAFETLSSITGRSTLSFLTFATFLFMVIVGKINSNSKRHIPLNSYLFITLIFFGVSLANNWVIGIGIPFPLIIVSRSGTLVANVLLTSLLQNRHYSINRIVSVLSVTCGITFFALNSQTNSTVRDDNFGFSVLVLGILTLFLTMFASAYLGVLQEKIFAQHGKHPDEMMFYVHLLSLPLFVFVRKEIQNDLKYYWNASNREIIFSLIGAIILLQFICIRSVYRLTSTLNSIQITMLLTLRKFLNIFFSILLFKHQFDWKHFLSTLLVLIGTFTFYEGHIKCIEWIRKNGIKNKNDEKIEERSKKKI